MRARALRLCAIALVALPWRAVAEEQKVEAPAPQEAEKKPWQPDPPIAKKWYSGSLDAGLDMEMADGHIAAHTDQLLQAVVTPPRRDTLSIHGSLWMWETLAREPEDSPLRSISDAYSSAVQLRVLNLYFQADKLWGDSTLRVGRQRILENPAFNLIDGVYFHRMQGIWDWYLFAGTRASQYDDVFQDPEAGGGFSVRPTRTTRIALDTFFAFEDRDESEPRLFEKLYVGRRPRAVFNDVDTRQLTLTFSQLLAERHQLYARYTLNNESSDELRVAFTGSFAWHDLAYEASYSRRLNVLADRVNDVTGYYRVLGNLDRYSDYFAALHLPFKDHYMISVEGQWHEVPGNNYGNSDFARYSLVFAANKLWKDSLDLNVSLGRWEVAQGQGTWNVTGEVTKRIGKTKVSLGSDYAVYENRLTEYREGPLALNQIATAILPGVYPGYRPLVSLTDTASVEVHEDVYTIYAKVHHDINDAQSFWFKLTYQMDDGPRSPYWRAQAQYSIRF